MMHGVYLAHSSGSRAALLDMSHVEARMICCCTAFNAIDNLPVNVEVCLFTFMIRHIQLAAGTPAGPCWQGGHHLVTVWPAQCQQDLSSWACSSSACL